MIEQYGPLVERLLSGAFICPFSDPDNYRRLQNDEVRQALDEYLRPLNRRLAQSQGSGVYFLGYLTFDEQARDVLKSQFSQTLQSLMPLLEWMLMVQEALGRDGALTAGDSIKLQEFVLKTEDNQSLRHRLQLLANDRFFNSQADSVDAQVKQIFKRLREHGYVRQPHAERQYFEVTGKVDYLVDLVRFIRDEENLPVSDEAEQEALL
ncbi:hypothetical protein CWE12_09985 [Aliidiomarina sedimenti]|uniref:DUF4194 domain-containing protein n=1 Tax=Aliidiomarina sedimenti TaxID=1933879 RepID=A0ABY0BY46_9GAMM|nr:hypothetical protein [Aliidiomarina sedimenti]RUO29302.1 hypothetical protein CWE12_09985 [Aliidiomarina sedimenti]